MLGSLGHVCRINACVGAVGTELYLACCNLHIFEVADSDFALCVVLIPAFPKHERFQSQARIILIVHGWVGKAE